MKIIYRKCRAHASFMAISENKNIEKCRGYFKEGNLWIAFDNSTNDFWVEEFKTSKKAICWLLGLFEKSDDANLTILKINSKMLFIPSVGYIKLEKQKQAIRTSFIPV